MAAKQELSVVIGATDSILDLSMDAFCRSNMQSAVLVEPLEQVIDELIEELKRKHIERLQRGECTIEMGFILSDVLADLDRISDHCSNIAGCLIEMKKEELDIHQYLRSVKHKDNLFAESYESFKLQYSL